MKGPGLQCAQPYVRQPAAQSAGLCLQVNTDNTKALFKDMACSMDSLSVALSSFSCERL